MIMNHHPLMSAFRKPRSTRRPITLFDELIAGSGYLNLPRRSESQAMADWAQRMGIKGRIPTAEEAAEIGKQVDRDRKDAARMYPTTEE